METDATVRQIEALLEQLGAAHAEVRSLGEELIRLLMQLYGAGLGRIVEMLRESQATELLSRLGDDELVASLLLLHGLHPVDPEMRLRAGLHRLERTLDSHRLVLAGIRDGVARIRVERNGHTPIPAPLRQSIERIALECAPDLAGVEIEGLDAVSLVQIAPAASR